MRGRRLASPDDEDATTLLARFCNNDLDGVDRDVRRYLSKGRAGPADSVTPTVKGVHCYRFGKNARKGAEKLPGRNEYAAAPPGRVVTAEHALGCRRPGATITQRNAGSTEPGAC